MNIEGIRDPSKEYKETIKRTEKTERKKPYEIIYNQQDSTSEH